MAVCGSLHPFHKVDQTIRGATCICDAVFSTIMYSPHPTRRYRIPSIYSTTVLHPSKNGYLKFTFLKSCPVDRSVGQSQMRIGVLPLCDISVKDWSEATHHNTSPTSSVMALKQQGQLFDKVHWVALGGSSITGEFSEWLLLCRQIDPQIGRFYIQTHSGFQFTSS